MSATGDGPEAPPQRPSEDDLAELIAEHGQLREDERHTQLEEVRSRAAEDPESRCGSFSADLVLREEGGFELWLGSLEDALDLEGLTSRGVDAFLNCAVEECERECAEFKVGRGRRRSHARGASAMTDSFRPAGAAEGACAALTREQVRADALFDGEWYSRVLGRETAYLGVSADDEPGYPIAGHFAELVAFLLRCRAERRKVLVHCVMGINRSVAAVVAFLSGGLGMDLAQAITLASRSRGHVLSNRSFLAQLAKAYGPGELRDEERTEMEVKLGSANGGAALQWKCGLLASLPDEGLCAAPAAPCIH